MSMRALFRDRRGGTAIEYAMIAALVAIGLIASIQLVGVSVESMFANLLSGFTG